MKDVIMRPSGRPEWDPTSLITSFGDMYDVTICFDFHQLLIATLLAYGSALKVVNAQKGQGTTGLVEPCRRVWVCGNLLSKIASSRMLRQHLAACQKSLFIPTFDHRSVYDDYMKHPTEDIDFSANADNPSSAVDDIGLEGGETLDEVFLKWVRLQAGYWLDLSLLSRTFGSSDPTYPVPEVFLVAVKHPKHDIDPLDPVEKLEATLSDLIGYNPDHPIDVEEILAVIRAKGGGENVYQGSIHCEMALVVLILLARNLSAAGIKKLGIIAGHLHVMFYLHHRAH
jgi:hypothetical protein